ncbi:Methylamine utilization protein MauE [compost metagenome]
MKLTTQTKSVIIELICLLYVLLFVYAAVSKLLDFENFQVQLGQSPLLSAFAWWVSRLVPTIELGIVVLLAVPKWRNLGLFASLSLMTLFTSYIFIVLHFSSFVPCSCGGILEKMSWNTHLVFNIVFVVLAALALLWRHQVNDKNTRHKIKWPLIKSIPIVMLSSTVFMIILFLSSEEIMQHENPFTRRYIRRSIAMVHTTDLKFNSYYFSGYNQNGIYLGNYTDPLRILAIDRTFKSQKVTKIDFKNRDLPFRLVTILIRGKYFYLMDGSVPCIFRGKVKDWKITEELKGIPKFTLAEPIDSSSVVFRNNSGLQAAHVLGVFNPNTSPKIHYAPSLLQKQIDGIFDTDGMLHFNTELGKIVHVYFYRNEIILADKKGVLVSRQHTIDTVSHAKIKVAYLKEGTQRKMAAPPSIVNAISATRGNLLFVQSKVPGLYENDAMWKQAAIIDVYNLKKNTYVLSFPLFGIEGSKLQSMFVTTTHLYAIIGTKLKVYELKGNLRKEMINGMQTHSNL